MKTHTHTRSLKEQKGFTPLVSALISLFGLSVKSSDKRRVSLTGFTLIEVLIVIGILAVLAGIVLVAINPARQFRQANNTERESNVNAILSAVGQYTVDNKGTLPPEIQADEDAIGGAGGDDFADLCDALVPKYLPALPVDPLVAQTDGDLSAEDKSITEDECDEDYVTGYTVEEEDGRTVVRAPQTENVDTGAVSDEPITVIR